MWKFFTSSRILCTTLSFYVAPPIFRWNSITFACWLRILLQLALLLLLLLLGINNSWQPKKTPNYALPFAVESVVAVCWLPTQTGDAATKLRSPWPVWLLPQPPSFLLSFCQRQLSFSLLSQWHFMIQTSLYMLTLL